MAARLGLKAHCLPCAACELWVFVAMAHLRSRAWRMVSRPGMGIGVRKPRSARRRRPFNGSGSTAPGT